MIIGIEVELHSDGLNYEDIKQREGLDYLSFKLIPNTAIGVKMSKEYYGSTIEYNFTPFENTLENFEVVKKYLEGQIKKYNLKLSCHAPAYVGTHIHIFEESKLNTRIKPLLENIMGWYLKEEENYSLLEKESLHRLFGAHQLWGNWSWNNEHSWIEILKSEGIGIPIYNDTERKTKYNPIIFSKATEQGKPPSLEVRIIPNEFMFNGKAFELMLAIDKKKLPGRVEPKIFFSTLIKKLKEKYYNNTTSSSRSMLFSSNTLSVDRLRGAVDTMRNGISIGDFAYIDDVVRQTFSAPVYVANIKDTLRILTIEDVLGKIRAENYNIENIKEFFNEIEFKNANSFDKITDKLTREHFNSEFISAFIRAYEETNSMPF